MQTKHSNSNTLRLAWRSIVFALICALALPGCIGNEELENAYNKIKKDMRTLKKDHRKATRELEKLEKSEQFALSQVESLRADLDKARKDLTKYKKVANEAEAVQAENDKKIADLEKKIKSVEQKKTTKKIYGKIHYWRPDRMYYDWGVHTKGLAVQRSTSWSDPIRFKYLTDYGAYAKIELHKDHVKHPLKFLVHSGAETDLISDKDREVEGLNRKLMEVDMGKNKDIYLVSGVPKIFYDKASALEEKNKAIEKLAAE